MSLYTFVALITFAFLAAAWVTSSWLLRRRERQLGTMGEEMGGDGEGDQAPS